VVKRAIILAPLSCLDKVWAQEIFTAATHRRFAILHGTAEKRRTLLADPHYDFYIINHDGYEIIAKQVHARTDINLIIVDEASEYRNAGTKRYKAFQHSLRADVRLWMLTGTPTPTAPTDAWALSKLVNPSGVHPSFTRFKERVMLQVSSYKWVPRPDAQEEVYRILQPAIRFDKRDCIDLPPTTYLDREAALSAAQKLAYEDMRKHMVLEAGGETITAANAAVKLGKLIQISCGVLYGPEKTRHHIGAPERIKVLKECIEQAGAKVIVFVPLTGALEYVASELRKHWTVAVVDGSVSANKRNQIFGDFQNSKDPHILVAHPETASHGLTLVAADMTIWYAPIFSADQYLQANNRTTRPGQTRHTTIVHIGSSEIEWAVYRTLRERKRVQETVLDLYRKITDKNA
jgi:SNF2 family DNA or RNA helicase